MFNSRERLYWEHLHWSLNLRKGYISDLIQNLLENRIRHASGPIRATYLLHLYLTISMPQAALQTLIKGTFRQAS